MGWRYTVFRVKYELLQKTGLFRRKFPVDPPYKQYITLGDWKENSGGNFFFSAKESLDFPKQPTAIIKEEFRRWKEGKLLLFNSTELNIGADYDWITNPDSGFKYDAYRHWTEISDYSQKTGDIKYVWEKSRFSFLYDIIRYDFHFGKDCSKFVFSEIISWINANPINCGPNFRCSQEISLRVLNWTFALHYYRNSSSLTEEIFNRIQHAIFWQMDHVFRNIDFSRIAVRNNHALTESLGLYLVALLYPQFPGATIWKTKGKKWFEEEIAYQIYEDGTYLQFSMNYHRVVVQLLTWALVLAEKNKEELDSIVFERANQSVKFLRTCMVDENGHLPNYGANDGALFFKLNNAAYRDYRPQLSALAYVLGIDLEFEDKPEDIYWYGVGRNKINRWKPPFGLHTFEIGGYYIFREPSTLTFIRCGNHKDRPSQADNLHLDVWFMGENILHDAGSYKYNTDQKILQYFMGTASHNTVMIENHDQMKKGPKFIWYYWTQCEEANVLEDENVYYFSGLVSAYRHLKKDILHRREITKHKNELVWKIKDHIINKPAHLKIKQLWHLPFEHRLVKWYAVNGSKRKITPDIQQGLFSSMYGKKENIKIVVFETDEDQISTEFSINTNTALS